MSANYTGTQQIMLTMIFWGLIFMGGLLMIMIFLLMMPKNIFLQQVILAKEYKQTLTIVSKDKINSASFRQKLDPISKNILRRQNPLELVFDDISTFDAKNPNFGSQLKEIDVGKKVITCELTKNTSKPPAVHFVIRKRLEKLKNRPEPEDVNDNSNLSPPLSPPRPPSSASQPPQPPLGPQPAPSLFPPPSARFLEPFQQPIAEPRPPPPLKPKCFINSYHQHHQHHHFHLVIIFF